MIAELYVLFCIVTVFGGAVDAIECPERWVTYQGSCYLFPHGMTSDFVTAENYCRQHNGHLVHVETAVENRFIKDYLRYEIAERHWIGLTDENVEGTWLWYDTGKPPTFTDWHPGQPDDGAAHQDCAVFHEGMGYDWDDEFCSHQYEPICEINFEEKVGLVG